MGIELEDDEVQTTADAAVAGAPRQARPRARRCTRSSATSTGIELVGEGADAVLIGGADETPETNLVFSYMNLARAFAELELGAELYCLHRNRWWQTKRGPLLDAGAFVAGLEYAAQVEAHRPRQAERRRTSPRRARRSTPSRSMTWMVGDDLESDIVGAHGVGMRTVLVRTGKFRPDARRGVARSSRTGSSRRSAHLPDWLEEHL